MEPTLDELHRTALVVHTMANLYGVCHSVSITLPEPLPPRPPTVHQPTLYDPNEAA